MNTCFNVVYPERNWKLLLFFFSLIQKTEVQNILQLNFLIYNNEIFTVATSTIKKNMQCHQNNKKTKLSPGQTIATYQRNIWQNRWAQYVACVSPPCCDLLQHVGCCWLKFENNQNCANNTQHVATHRKRVAKRTQHVAPNNVAICCVCMLRSFGRGLSIQS